MRSAEIACGANIAKGEGRFVVTQRAAYDAGMRIAPCKEVEDGQETDAAPRSRPTRRIYNGRYVTLEPLARTHAASLWPLAREASESWRWMPVGPFVTYAAFETYVRLVSASHDEIIWCARPHTRDERVGEPAGWLGLLDVRPNDAALELGNIWFPPILSRSRASTEAMFLLLEEAFDRLHYRRVAWKCDALNLPSRSCARRLGFRCDGTLRAHMIVKGRRRDSAYFSMLSHEWPARRDALTTWLDPNNFDSNGQQISSLRRSL